MRHRVIFIGVSGLLLLLMVVFIKKTTNSDTSLSQMQPVNAADYAALIQAVPPSPAPTLVHFFSSWCASCIADHTIVKGLSSDFDLVGIATMDKRAAVEAWLKKHGNPYRTLIWDEDGTLAIASGVRGLPETFLMDHGKMWRHRGPLNTLIPPKP